MTYLLEILNYLAIGAGVSLKIFFVTLALSLPLSIWLIMIYRLNYLARIILSIYTWLFRGTPLMLQLFFFMYGLPALGIPVNRMTVAYTAFILNYTAYFIEIVRAGIESLPKDQFESARVEGCKPLTMYRYIILPQALRNVLPVITNEVITLIKDTSLVTVIAITDLMRAVKEIVARDFTISPFVVAAAFYLFISFFIVQVAKTLEKKYNFIESAG
jgi:polar amino acid transport system permease protein